MDVGSGSGLNRLMDQLFGKGLLLLGEKSFLMGVALKLDPKDINALVNRSELYLQLGELEAAIADLKSARELDPKLENPASARAQALAAATAAIAVRALAKE
jgi:tetratricopeptide (TPR) repeat protein